MRPAEAWLGRVLNAMAEPIDGLKPLEGLLAQLKEKSTSMAEGCALLEQIIENAEPAPE